MQMINAKNQKNIFTETASLKNIHLNCLQNT